jgi:hypothetical protein
MSLPAPDPREQPEAIRPTEKDLLRWAIENSEDASNIRKEALMSHEEFKEMWNTLCPDAIKQLKDNLALIRSNPDDEQMYLGLDRLLYLVEDIDAADWFVDLDGYKDAVTLMDSPNPEVRMAAAWVISNTLQNNPKVQRKFIDKVGLEPCLASFDREAVEKPAIRKFSLVSNAIRGFKPLRTQFYQINGVQRLLELCERFPALQFRFCWMIGAVLDEEDQEDLKVFNDLKVKQFLVRHAQQINDDDVLKSVVDRLQ